MILSPAKSQLPRRMSEVCWFLRRTRVQLSHPPNVRVSDLLDVFDFLPGSGGAVRPFLVGPGAAVVAAINYLEAREKASWARDIGLGVPEGQVARLFWVLFCTLLALVCLKKCFFLMRAMRHDQEKDWIRGGPGWMTIESWADAKRRFHRATLSATVLIGACLIGATAWAERMAAQPL